MKKGIAFLLSMLLLVSLSACGKKENVADVPDARPAEGERFASRASEETVLEWLEILLDEGH